jgi:hypothetical protein
MAVALHRQRGLLTVPEGTHMDRLLTIGVLSEVLLGYLAAFGRRGTDEDKTLTTSWLYHGDNALKRAG